MLRSVHSRRRWCIRTHSQRPGYKVSASPHSNFPPYHASKPEPIRDSTHSVSLFAAAKLLYTGPVGKTGTTRGARAGSRWYGFWANARLGGVRECPRGRKRRASSKHVQMSAEQTKSNMMCSVSITISYNFGFAKFTCQLYAKNS